MRLSLASTLLLLSIYNHIVVDAFSPSSPSSAIRTRTQITSLFATVHVESAKIEEEEEEKDDVEIRLESWAQKCGYEFPDHVTPLTGEEINARRDVQLQKMRMKDKTSAFLEKEVRFWNGVNGGACLFGSWI